MSEVFVSSRREFLALAGAGAVGAAGAASAGPALEGVLAGAAGQHVVLVHDPDLVVPAGLASRLAAQGGRVVALAGDPVRLWRDGLKVQVEQAGSLYGLTLWADLLIFQGLARELRRNLQHSRVDAATGRIAWMIA
jgi:hypothetical protein